MSNLVPGGYLFTHAVFWLVVGLVAVGTNAVAIILSIGLGLLAFETVTKNYFLGCCDPRTEDLRRAFSFCAWNMVWVTGALLPDCRGNRGKHGSGFGTPKEGQAPLHSNGMASASC